MALLKSFDTTTLSNEGVEMELKDIRTGKGSGAFIKLLGKDSDTFREIKTERGRALSERVAAGNSDDYTPEELDAMGCDLLARCTVGWRGLDGENGELVFSLAAARDLYRSYPAIREQVNVYIADRANFVSA